MRTLSGLDQNAGPEIALSGEILIKRPAGRSGRAGVDAPGGSAAGERGEHIVPDRLGLVRQDHHRGIREPLVIALGLARLVNGEADDKTSLGSADLSFVKCVRTEERMMGLKPYSVKELFLELAPGG